MWEGWPEINKEEQSQPKVKTPETMKAEETAQATQEAQKKTGELNGEVMTYNNAFREVKSDVILWVKDFISNTINEKFKDLSPEKKENIKFWILGKLINSWTADLMAGWLNSKLKEYNNLLEKKDFDSLMGIFNTDEKSTSSKEGALEKVKQFFDQEINLIFNFINKNKNSPALDKFLSSPKNISELNNETILTEYISASPEEERNFYKSIKDKVNGYDTKLVQAEKTKEHIFDLTANIWNSDMRNRIIKFASFLCSLPIIWDFIKAFLWLKWDKNEEIEAELNEQIELRKSVNWLKDYWIKYNDKWELIKLKNDPEIPILKDKDLSKISYKETKNFIAFCKKSKIDINAKDFWYNVFETKTIETEIKDESWNKIKKIMSFNFEIKESDFYESTKEPNMAFFKKLNDFVDIKSKTAQVNQETPNNSVPEITPVIWMAAWLDKSDSLINSYKKRDAEITDAINKATIFPIWIKYSQKDKNLSYPEIIDFDKSTKQIIIWNDKFKINIPDEQWVFWVKNWKLENIAINWEIVDFTFSWQIWQSSWTKVKQKSKEELSDIVTKLVTNKRHTIVDWDSRAEITKTA